MGYFFDGNAKIINLTTGTTNVSVRDLWSRYCDWLAIGDNSKYVSAMRVVGGDPLPGSKELGLTFFLRNGWKIRPYEGDHTLNIEGNLYSEDGSSPYSAVLGSFNVMIISSVSNLVDSTVQQLPEIEYSSYNGGVTIDVVNGTDSSVYPYGTPLYPCKTTANSYAIRMARGFKKIYLKSDLTLTGIPDGVLTGLDIVCEVGNRNHTLTIDNVLVTDCKATNLTVTGTFKEGSTAQAIDCEIHTVDNVSLRAEKCKILHGHYENTELTNCTLEGDIDIKGGGTMSGIGIVFEGDFSTIDMQNMASTVSLDIESGYFKLINSVAGCLAEFNLRGGEIELDPSCVAGDFYIEGYGTLYNNSTMTIKGDNLISPSLITNGSSDPLTKEAIREEMDNNSTKLLELQVKTDELHRVGGLDSLNPATTTRYSITAGDINIDISGDGETETTFTRND